MRVSFSFTPVKNMLTDLHRKHALAAISFPPIVIDLDGRLFVINAYDEVVIERLYEVEELKRIHEVDVHTMILNDRLRELEGIICVLDLLDVFLEACRCVVKADASVCQMCCGEFVSHIKHS